MKFQHGFSLDNHLRLYKGTACSSIFFFNGIVVKKGLQTEDGLHTPLLNLVRTDAKPLKH
jgi:hypothetical protein